MIPITPTDDIVGPVTHQLALALSTNVVGIGRMYEEPPDGPPENGSVIFPLQRIKYEGDTNGKEYVRMTFSVKYMIRRTKFPANLLSAYAFFSAISRVLAAWPTQTLQDPTTLITYAMEVTPKDATITQFIFAGQAFVCLAITTEVLTEFNIITS